MAGSARARERQPESTKASLEEQIRMRAHEIYLQRGDEGGSALDDWLQAEREILAAQDAAVDEASRESFPASDPPAFS